MMHFEKNILYDLFHIACDFYKIYIRTNGTKHCFLNFWKKIFDYFLKKLFLSLQKVCLMCAIHGKTQIVETTKHRSLTYLRISF